MCMYRIYIKWAYYQILIDQNINCAWSLIIASMTLPTVPNNRTDEAELKYTESCPGWAECCTEYGYCQPKVNMKWHFFHQHLKLFQLTTVGLGGEVVPRLQWREQWLGGNLKLENIFSKSNLVDGSFHFSFLMKQRLQSLKLPAMATRGLKQRNIVISFFERQWAGAP